jgi:HipA-like protein
MRKAAVYLRGEYAGELTEISRREYVFRYDDKYFTNPRKPAIRMSRPKH